MTFEITGLYAALCALLIMALTVVVIRRRVQERVSLGEGPGAGRAAATPLRRAVRAHANAVETIPLALILMLCAESIGAPSIALHLAGATLLIGRAAHAYAILADVLPARMIGMISTFTATGLLALGLVGHTLL